MANPVTRRQEALSLADELLGDVELGRLSALDIARRASRLARLLDDADATSWLAFEIAGYPATSFDRVATAAATRSGRGTTNEGGGAAFWTSPLGTLDLDVRSGLAELEKLGAAGPSGDWAYRVELDRAKERSRIRGRIDQSKGLLDKIIGAIHGYVADRYQELRFGSAVEGAFEVVRTDVDAQIASLVPGALPMLTAAMENAVSQQPEHWANAASTCRRLLKLSADALRPPGPDALAANGKTLKMGDVNYINRLISWIEEASTSETSAAMITADLDYLGRRLDAADSAGHKGAHNQVSRFEASRFITGTYLVLGDVLRLRAGPTEGATAHPAR
jgi:hypothetical protein